MKPNTSKTSETHEVAKRMIESALLLDETLAELLKVEIKRLKKMINTNPSIDDLTRTNALIKNIIFAMTLTDEKIRTGIKLWELDDQ